MQLRKAPGGTVVLIIAISAWGCAPQRASTRLAIDDLDRVALQMAQSLTASDFLSQRGPDAPSIAIVVDHVENLSSDLLTEAEQWMLVARVRAALPLRSLADARNVRFLIPPERWRMLVEERHVARDETQRSSRRATHVMSAVLRSVRRAGAARNGDLTDLRADIYAFAFQIVALPSRELVWSDTFEFRREARGRVID